VGVDEAREVGGGDWVIEDVFADYEIGKVEAERRVHVEGGLA
jgi:hypothetical protein